MDHKSRKNQFKRGNGYARTPRQHILYVEGRNTEKSYRDLLKRANCKIMPVTVKGHGISRCEDFVKESENAWKTMPKEEKQKYSKRWLVFDADGRADFAAGIRLARQKRFGVVFSNMCIEYWFLLHFQDHDGSPIPMVGNSHSKAQIDKINKHINAYNKKAKVPVKPYDEGSKTVGEDFFELMLADDPVTHQSRIVNAFERAEIIHRNKLVVGAEFTESVTTMYQLLLALGVIEKKKGGGYNLYRK